MQKKKILLVEDDTTLAQVYKSRLELEGFEVQHLSLIHISEPTRPY